MATFRSTLAVVGAVTIASALATEAMESHYILGAFVAGVVTPENLRKPLLDRLQVMTVALLMPFFFMLTGFRMLIDPASTAFLEIFVAATAVAVIGKIGGSAITARITGEVWPTALGLGALLQTKGLMEADDPARCRDYLGQRVRGADPDGGGQHSAGDAAREAVPRSREPALRGRRAERCRRTAECSRGREPGTRERYVRLSPAQSGSGTKATRVRGTARLVGPH